MTTTKGKKIKVAIAGCSGFIGSALQKKILSLKNISLHCLSREEIQSLPNSKPEFNFDVVVNLAGLISIDQSWENPYPYFHDNYLITLKLLDLCRNSNARFIHMSTYLYGSPKSLPTNEDVPLKFSNPYSSSKYLCEKVCESFNELFNLDVTILRLFNVYGIGQSRKFLIPYIVYELLTKNVVSVRNIQSKRDYLWLEDIVDALIAVIMKPIKGYNFYNLASGESTSAGDVINIVSKYCPNPKIINQNQKLEILESYGDIKKFSQEFKWKPKTSIEQGVRAMIKDFNTSS